MYLQILNETRKLDLIKFNIDNNKQLISLLENTFSELAGSTSHRLLMLKVKQRSCEVINNVESLI